jgi:2'-5' RNA ligase
VSATGTSSGRIQSAVLIPVPQAEPLVERWRLEHDPVASEGVPAHITLIVPWLPPAELTEADYDELVDALSAVDAFDFTLSHVGWFGRKVLWLAPEPVAPFLHVIKLLSERFGTPPWDDEFDEVVPHLTVGHASDGVELAPVADALAAQLPLACRAEEAWVMVGDGSRWFVRRRIPLA